MKQILITFTLLITGCGPSVPQYLERGKDGKETITCHADIGTSKDEFLRTCGKAHLWKKSRGCYQYRNDKYEYIFYCFENDELDEILDMRGWILKSDD